MPELLSDRALNRTLLARQGLLEPWQCSPIEAIERLVGLQAQVPLAPYFGLFSRLISFDPAELSTLLVERKAVRIALMRSTLQLVSARDCLRLRPVLAADLLRVLPPGLRNRPDLAAIAAAARDCLERRPATFAELGSVLAASFAGVSGPDLSRIARNLVAMVQVPPRGLWGRSGPAAHAVAERWLGEPLAEASDPAPLIRRYLAAFGPATAADLAAWSGLSGAGAALRSLGSELRCYTGERGQLLYDLDGAPLAVPELAVPVRIVAEFDNLLLGHADRSRIFDDRHRGRFMAVNGLVSSTVLVDGFVAGSCRLKVGTQQATVTIEPFTRLSRADHRVVSEQAARLLQFAAPDHKHAEVRFVS